MRQHRPARHHRHAGLRPATGTVFLVASIGGRVSHQLVALDPATGEKRWRRVGGPAGRRRPGHAAARRAAVLNGRVCVPFGGLAGDCGQYKGRLVGVPLGNGEPVAYTVPTTREAGIWTPPGATVFNGHLLVAVGNGESVGGGWDGSDSVLELDGTRLGNAFSPSNWAADNGADLDLGSLRPTSGRRKVDRHRGQGRRRLRAAGRTARWHRGQVSQAELCRAFGGSPVAGNTVYVPCADGLGAVRIDGAGTFRRGLARRAADRRGSPVLGGGRVYSLSPGDGVLSALDPATGKVRERVPVGGDQPIRHPGNQRCPVVRAHPGRPGRRRHQLTEASGSCKSSVKSGESVELPGL